VILWKEYFSRIFVYITVSILSGALTGILFSIIVYFLTFWLNSNVKIFIIILLSTAYLINETRLAKIPIPQNHWQIPTHWVNGKATHNMIVWGSILGSGMFTYIPHATFYIIYIYIGLFRAPFEGLLWGGVYAFTRTLPSILLAALRNLKLIESDGDINKIASIKYLNRILNGFALTCMLIFILFFK
jgi:hypothetical protein